MKLTFLDNLFLLPKEWKYAPRTSRFDFLIFAIINQLINYLVSKIYRAKGSSLFILD